MLTDLEAALICRDTYHLGNRWDDIWQRSGIWIGGRAGSMLHPAVLAFRGSVDPIDWLRDLHWHPRRHPVLGWCHAGFLTDLELVFDEVGDFVRQANELHVVGHSLGAARALLFAALLRCYGLLDVAVTVFGSPRPAFGGLRRLLAGCPVRSFKNRRDKVTQVPPWWIPWWPYSHPEKLIPIDGGAGPDPFDPFNDHHIDLYVRGIIAKNAANNIEIGYGR